MTDRTLKIIQVAIEAGILICLMVMLGTSIRIGKFAEENALYSDQGLAVRVINSDKDSLPVKIETEMLEMNGHFIPQFDVPIPVKIYTGYNYDSGKRNNEYDVPIPVVPTKP